jgi:hypothetical protein
MLARNAARLTIALVAALCLVISMTSAALADPRNFNINNNSDYVIQHAYVSASVDPEWGDDILGKDVLNPGEVWQIGFDRGAPDTCVWDLKVITVEGLEVNLPQLDLCSITDVNINN